MRFLETNPVPEDAAETLDVLLAIEKRPHAHQIIDLHFKEGKLYAEIGEVVGRSPERIRQIINEAARKVRQPNNLWMNGATLRYGLKANNRIAKGETGICRVCGKLIEAADSAFVAPSDDISPSLPSRFTPIQLMCCSRECAEASIKRVIESHENRIKAILDEKQRHEQAIERLQEYIAKPMSLQEAQDELNRKNQK